MKQKKIDFVNIKNRDAIGLCSFYFFGVLYFTPSNP